MRPPKLKAIQAYEGKVDQLLGSVRGAFEQLQLAILAADRDRLIAWAENMVEAFANLETIYPSENWPSWFSSLRANASIFLNKKSESDASQGLIRFTYKFRDVVEKFDWSISGSDFSLDVDEILEDELNKSAVDQKFEEIINQLSDLISSQEIDHDKAFDDLTALLAMLRSAKAGSFSEKIVTWKFARRFLINLATEYAKSIPGIKQFLLAAEQTASELDVELAEVGKNSAKRIYERIQENFHSGLLPAHEPVALLPDLTTAAAESRGTGPKASEVD